MTSSVILFFSSALHFLSYMGTKAYYVGTPQLQILEEFYRLCKNLKVVSTGKVQRYTSGVGRQQHKVRFADERERFFFGLWIAGRRGSIVCRWAR